MKATTGSDLVFSLALVFLFFALCAALAQPLVGERFSGNNQTQGMLKR